MNVRKAVSAAIALAASALIAPAFAQSKPAPAEVLSVLKAYQTNSVSIEPGNVVLVVLPRPVATWPIAQNLYTAFCYPAAEGKPRPWGGTSFSRLEVRNDIKAQGYSLPTSAVDCKTIGHISADAAEKQKRLTAAWVCVAGNPCRERRPGEKTAGDQ